ncbi:MAG: mannose-6-phosphate isomerase, class I [Deltaproteobacteria bacterium]|nr:MAG: mannose-6-phosphate isomerase, class I [Deltaproteobacteria bacterium]
MEPQIVYLDAPVRPYAWGSRQTLAELQGRAFPTAEPEAEIWYGAHPVAPAMVGRDTGFVGLDAFIAMNPTAMLGPTLMARFGDQLPFLLKILAVERPLSIQAHPDKERARLGFLEETRRRVPLAAPQRSYRDPRPKPEQVVALSEFDALVGFRPRDELKAICDAWRLDGLPLDQVVNDIIRGGDAVTHALHWARSNTRDEAGVLGEVAATFDELDAIYPEDPGLPVAMLLNRVRLQPGEALFLGPGLLHAYLHGTAVEVMGNSDNTLRCGLTQKFINGEALMSVVNFEPQPPEVLRPHADGVEQVYPSDTAMFSLSVIDVDGHVVPPPQEGPDIVLCVSGEVTVSHGRRTVSLGQGEACFVPHECSAFTLDGCGRVFRARTGVGED